MAACSASRSISRRLCISAFTTACWASLSTAASLCFCSRITRLSAAVITRDTPGKEAEATPIKQEEEGEAETEAREAIEERGGEADWSTSRSAEVMPNCPLRTSASLFLFSSLSLLLCSINSVMDMSSPLVAFDPLSWILTSISAGEVGVGAVDDRVASETDPTAGEEDGDGSGDDGQSED